MSLPKSTVYYHFKREVGQKQKERAPQIPEDQEFRGELRGIFAGDGSFQKTKNGNYKVKIHLNRKKDYWKLLKNYFSNNLKKEPFVCTHREDKIVLLYCSKSIYTVLRKYLDWRDNKTSTIFFKVQEHSQGFLIGALRGLIDTDGHFQKQPTRYTFTTVSERLSTDISNYLEELGIRHRREFYQDKRPNRLSQHKVVISNKNCLEFDKLIEPRNPLRQVR